MTTELAVGLGFKILWASFAGFIAHIYWSIRRDKQKLDNTYTKDETDRAIEAKLEPTIQKVDNIHSMRATRTINRFPIFLWTASMCLVLAILRDPTGLQGC